MCCQWRRKRRGRWRYELTATELEESVVGNLVDSNYGQLSPNASIGLRVGERTKLTAG